jgi:putative NIF3 family GTP cyclohydrolase 1 type 2
MKLKDLYRRVVEAGIANDLRGAAAIAALLEEEKARFEKLPEGDRADFDADRLFNPFSDTRLLTGDPETEVRTIIAGIDMDVSELLLAQCLKKDGGRNIDLVIAHHPQGRALSRLYDVMRLQVDLLASCGVTLGVAEKLMDKRIDEVERRLMPANHNRTVDAARLLGLPLMCIHTAADNCVTHFLTRLFEREKPARLKDVLSLLKAIPEYRKAASLQVPPKIVSGSEDSRCGTIFVDMTGGTEGSKDSLEKLASAGVSTLVGMHISEEHLETAKKANLNVVIAGHISSDSLGLNVLLDEVEKEEEFKFVCTSGFERVRRAN